MKVLANGNDQKDGLSDDEKPNFALIEEVRSLLKKEFEEKGGEKVYAKQHYEDLMDRQSPLVCWRYLLYRGKAVEAAFELMKSALVWRKEYNVDSLEPAMLAKEFWLKAPAGFCGKTRNGSEILFTIGKDYRKPDSSVKQIIRDFLTYLLCDFERRHKNDLDTLVLVIDQTGTGLRNIDIDFSKWLVSIRDFFPNRFAAVQVVGVPFIVRPFIRLVISWLPEHFKRIIHCGTVEQLLNDEIDSDQWPLEAGGTSNDKWRLAPPGALWNSQSKTYSEEQMEKIDEAVLFDIPQERIDQLFKMQQDYDESLGETK